MNFKHKFIRLSSPDGYRQTDLNTNRTCFLGITESFAIEISRNLFKIVVFSEHARYISVSSEIFVLYFWNIFSQSDSFAPYKPTHCDHSSRSIELL